MGLDKFEIFVDCRLLPFQLGFKFETFLRVLYFPEGKS